MMENKWLLLKSFITLIALGFVLSCSVLQKAVKQPRVHVQELKYHPVSLQAGRLDSRIQISNPNGFALPVRTLSYTLTLNGQVFADSKVSFDKDIPAQGTMVLKVPINFHYGELMRGISSMLTQQNIRFQLKGKLNLGLFDVPFSKTGDFALRY